MEDLRTVNVRLDAKMFRRLALSASLNRRSLGNEAAVLLDQMLSSTKETEVERENGEIAVAAVTRVSKEEIARLRAENDEFMRRAGL